MARLTFTGSTLLIPLLAFGCAHTYRVEGFDADRANLRNSQNKKIAVVFAEPEFKRRYEASVEGHSFVFEDLKAFYEQAYSSALAGSVASVEYFTAEPKGDYDVYLYPSLSLNMRSRFLAKLCSVEYGLIARDRSKNEIAKRSEGVEHPFAGMTFGEPKTACKIAMLKSFAPVTYDVFKRIDGR